MYSIAKCFLAERKRFPAPLLFEMDVRKNGGVWSYHILIIGKVIGSLRKLTDNAIAICDGISVDLCLLG